MTNSAPEVQATTPPQHARPTWSRVLVGNVAFEGVPVERTVLVANGYTLLEVGTGRTDGVLELTAHFADSRGHARAYLRRNTWAFDQEQYDTIVTPRRVLVRERARNDHVLDVARLPDACTVAIRTAQLFTPNGLRVLIDETTGVTLTECFRMRTVYAAANVTEIQPLGRITLDRDGVR